MATIRFYKIYPNSVANGAVKFIYNPIAYGPERNSFSVGPVYYTFAWILSNWFVTTYLINDTTLSIDASLPTSIYIGL